MRITAFSSVSEQSSEEGTKSQDSGMVCFLDTFLHPTESKYFFMIDLQYQV